MYEVEDGILEKAAATFAKSVETLNEEVDEIIEWLKTQHHLPEIMDKTLVRNFYLLNKCRSEKAKERIENYYTIRSQTPEIFENINPKLPNMKNVLEILYFVPLPKLTEGMYRVFFFKVRDKNEMSQLDPYDMLRYIINMMEIRLHEDVAFGDVSIVDAKDLNVRFLMKITPLFLYRILKTIYEKIYASRLKAVYIFNAPAFLETVMKLLQKVITPKLFGRFHIYKDPKIIEEKFSKEVLPSDYGGLEKSLPELQELMIQKFAEYEDRFDQLDKMKVNEALKPEKHKSFSFFGLYRS